MHRTLIFCFFSISIIICSCSRYKPFRTHYQFKSPDGKPHYEDLDYWAAHPWKWDPSDSVPLPLRKEFRDTTIDVFFLHPTTYNYKRKKKLGNALIDDHRTNAKTDYSTVLYQASVFNHVGRIFSPRYRQIHISGFFQMEEPETKEALELAYQDIRTSFIHYLENWNNSRPLFNSLEAYSLPVVHVSGLVTWEFPFSSLR